MKTNKHQGNVDMCQICGSDKLELFISFGHQAVVQAYLDKKGLHEPEATYPLNLVRCLECGLVQIDYIVDPNIVFPKIYPYRTGLTNMLIRNFQSLSEIMDSHFKFQPGELIVDIGSNDGTLLKPFKKLGLKVLGVEPTNAAKDANKVGIPTIQSFFDAKTVAKIVKSYGRARFVTATNAFAHINNTKGLIKNVKDLLAPRGIFVSESQYLMDMIEKKEFDTVYHEHLRFYSLKPIIKLIESAGMKVFDAERISAAGGSIRVYAVHDKNAKASERLKGLIAAEEKAGLYKSETYHKLREGFMQAKNDLVSLVIKCKNEGARIYALGSPARANTLLGFTGINSHFIDYACEKSGSPKIGLYTPGTHIPVVDESRLNTDQPEYTLVLSWHIGEELIEKIWAAGYKGKFIIPLPKPKIYAKKK